MQNTQCLAIRFISAIGSFTVVVVLGAVPVQAQVFADLDQATVDYSAADLSPQKACEEMARFMAQDLVSVEARTVEASGDAPLHCEVTGVLSPEIAFQVNLPSDWNRRFYMIGNGGHAGEALDAANRISQRNDALQLGFAFAQTNTGHYSSEEPGASFVLSDPQKAIDYAYRGVHLTAVTAKDVIRDYYGLAPSYSYWNSCSNGGRQGLIEVQRFPEDFDGVVANAPWVDQTGFTIGAMWNQRALTEAPLTADNLTLLADRVMDKCDLVDGLEDGLIDDPRQCDFDPARDVPACGVGSDGAACLTGAQAEAISKIYNGPVSNGTAFFPGFMLGSEMVVSGGFGAGGDRSNWMNLIVPAEPGDRSADFNLAENTMRYLVHTPPNPDYDYRTFDFDRDISMVDDWSAKADAKDPDLSDFRERGGKLLMTYGWADPILQPMMGINYFEEAVAVNGPDTTDFFRLFMVPGMSHCGGGIGTDQFDSMTALIDWVESDKAPDSIHASRVVNDEVVRTRPLCPYPQVARYSGEGSIDDAANFSCAAPGGR